MPVRTATGEWHGTLKEGKGTVAVGSKAFNVPYNFVSRFETGSDTNPEELIGAAHAGCFSMALSADLGNAGFTPTSVRTTASVHLNFVDGVPTVDLIELDCEAAVPDIDAAKFAEIAQATVKACPISRALASVKVTLKAQLAGSAA